MYILQQKWKYIWPIFRPFFELFVCVCLCAWCEFVCGLFFSDHFYCTITMISWPFRGKVEFFFLYRIYTIILLLFNLFHLVLSFFLFLLNTHSFVTFECYLSSFCLFVLFWFCFKIHFIRFRCTLFLLCPSLIHSFSIFGSLHQNILPQLQWQSAAITLFVGFFF